MSRRIYKGVSGNPSGGGESAGMRDATDIEDAAHAINAINRRKRIEAAGGDREQRERARITLSPALDAWLKKDVP